MSTTDEIIEYVANPANLNWVDAARKEITELEVSAAADPKVFFGNRPRGMGKGLERVKTLAPVLKELAQALNKLDRVL